MISKANQRFSSGLALTFGARLLMATNSVVAGVLVARLLGAESLGIYLVLMTAVQMLIQVANFGLPVANTFFTAREAENLRPAAINSVLLCLLTGSIGALLVWAFSDVVLVGVPAQLAILGLLCVPFQLVTSVLFNLFLARDEVKTFNFLDLLNQSFILINAVVVLLILSSGLWILVGFNTAASVGMSVLTAVMFYSYVSGKRFPGKWRLDLGLLGRTIRFSTKGHILWISQIFVQRLDLIIVNYFRGATEASVYAVATQCTLFLLMLPLAVSQLLQVRVSSDRDEGGEFTCRVARQTSMILFAACLASVPAAFVVARIYGQGFEDLPYQLWLLLPGVFCVGVQQVIAQHFVGRGMPVFLPISWLATVAVNIAANVFVVPIYGARGAAIVATLSYFGIAGVVISSFVRKTRFGLGNVLIPNRQDIKETINIVRGLLPFRRTE